MPKIANLYLLLDVRSNMEIVKKLHFDSSHTLLEKFGHSECNK